MKGMILAAGIGTRLRPLTDHMPKALVSLGDYSMMDLAIAFLLKHGIDEIVINAHHFAQQLIDYANLKNSQGYKISISDESNLLLDTGGGLKNAAPFFQGEHDFVLMAVDILSDLDLTAMIAQHNRNKSLATLAVRTRETSRSLLFDQQGNLAGWRNNQSGEQKNVQGRTPEQAYGFSGIHLLNTRIFSLMKETGAFSIIDLYLRLAEMENIKMFDHTEGLWLEFGRAEKLPSILASDEYKSILKGIFT